MKITSFKLSLVAVALFAAHASGKVIIHSLFGNPKLDLEYTSGIDNGNVVYEIGLVGAARSTVKQWSLTFVGNNANFYVSPFGNIQSGPADQVCQNSLCLFDGIAGPDPTKAFTGKEKAPGHQAALDSFMAGKHTFTKINVLFKDGTNQTAKLDEL